MKLKKLTRFWVFLISVSYCFAQKEDNINNIYKLNNTLVCRNIIEKDSLSTPVDTFYLRIGELIIIDKKRYNVLYWGTKDLSFGYVRIYKNNLWYLPKCSKYKHKEYKMFDFFSFNSCSLYCLDGFEAKHNVRLKNKEYHKESDSYLYKFKIEEYKPSFAFFLQEINFSYKNGIESMQFYIPHNEYKYMKCKNEELKNP